MTILPLQFANALMVFSNSSLRRLASCFMAFASIVIVRMADSFIVEILSKPPKLYVLQHKEVHLTDGYFNLLV
jgi:hypothetical protein